MVKKSAKVTKKKVVHHKKKHVSKKAEEPKEVCKPCSDGIKISADTLMVIGAIVGVILIIVLVLNIDKILPSGDSGEVDDSAAYVNGISITNAQLDEEIAKLPAAYTQNPNIEPAVLRQAVLDEMIAKNLLLQKADEMWISVTDEEVEEELTNFMVESGLSEEDLDLMLEEQSLTLEDVHNVLKEQLIINNLLEAEVLESIEVTDAEIEARYNELEAELTEYMASHILVCYEGKTRCEENRTQEEALAIVSEVLSRIEGGEEFGALAEEYSDGPSAEMQGDLGWFRKGMMVAEFENAVFELDVGEISEGVETSYGYHVIKLTDKKEGLEDYSEYIEEELLLSKNQQAISDYVSELKNNANIEYVESDSDVVTEIAVAGNTFYEASEEEVCMEDGKPIIRMFSTTWCPHCEWIKDTFDKVAKEYVDEGKIVAHHWELDIGDDTLTDVSETVVPESETAIFSQFNPTGGVPTFIFGCKYYRIGNGYEATGDLASEEAEFREIIEGLIS